MAERRKPQKTAPLQVPSAPPIESPSPPVPDWNALRSEFLTLLRRPLANGTDAAAKIAALRALHNQTETVLASFSDPASLVACGPGCGYCCIVNVAVLEPEALLIARTVRAMESAGREYLLERLRQLDLETAGISDEERLVMQRPCAFLDAAGNCVIHPVRPLLCRRLTSIDPADCRRAVVMAVFDETVPITADLNQGKLYEVAFTALAEALAEVGCDDRSSRLSSSVLELLTVNPKEEAPDSQKCCLGNASPSAIERSPCHQGREK